MRPFGTVSESFIDSRPRIIVMGCCWKLESSILTKSGGFRVVVLRLVVILAYPVELENIIIRSNPRHASFDSLSSSIVEIKFIFQLEC